MFRLTEEIIVLIAKICHNVNKAYCEEIGDYSQPNWNQAEDWRKQSAIDGVEKVIENPNITPEESHKNWMIYKMTNGWVFGEEKDSVKKTHPCITEYVNLPQDQKLKDVLFISIVKSFLC